MGPGEGRRGALREASAGCWLPGARRRQRRASAREGKSSQRRHIPGPRRKSATVVGPGIRRRRAGVRRFKLICRHEAVLFIADQSQCDGRIPASGAFEVFGVETRHIRVTRIHVSGGDSNSAAPPCEQPGEKSFHAGREAGAVVLVAGLADGLRLGRVGMNRVGDLPKADPVGHGEGDL